MQPTSIAHAYLDAAREILPEVIALRRRLHRVPEVGLELPRTQAIVLDEVRGLGLDPIAGVAVGSVVATIEGSGPGPTILLRADMDALPLTEETGLEFASEHDGRMHACGHDTHVAMLLGAARLLIDERASWPGRVLLMFQPGEEGFHGARFMLEEGLLDQSGGERPSGALALHISTLYDSGTIDVRPGPMLASSDTLRITVRGRGGHASTPHTARRPDRRGRRDRPRPAADGHPSRRRVRPGGRHDRPGRGRDDDQHHPRDRLPRRHDADASPRRRRTAVAADVRRVCDGRRGRPWRLGRGRHRAGLPGHGQRRRLRRARPVGRRARWSARSRAPAPAPIMGAEDFSYVLQQVPGAIAFVGARPPDVDPATAPMNHSNRVVFDESAMAAGIATYVGVARRFLWGLRSRPALLASRGAPVLGVAPPSSTLSGMQEPIPIVLCFDVEPDDIDVGRDRSRGSVSSVSSNASARGGTASR